MSVLDVARRLGISTNRQYVASCPACGASRALERGRVALHGGGGVGCRGNGGRCFKCNETFDAIDYVSLTIFRRRFSRGELTASQKAELRGWFGGTGGAGAGTSNANASNQPSVHASVGRASGGARECRSASVADAAVDATQKPFPHLNELKQLWAGSKRHERDPELVRAYFASRGLDALAMSALFDRNIVRALTPNSPIFSWSTFGGHGWYVSGHCLISLLYDSRGAPRSCVARRISGEHPKSVSPRDCGRSGLVLADDMGQHVLGYGRHPSQWPHRPQPGVPFDSDTNSPWWPPDEPLRVIIVEGEVDLWTWSTEQGESTEYPPAILGVLAGAWTQAHADRIPDGAHVTIATDRDDAGDAYARQIIKTLRGRNIVAGRHRPPQPEGGAA